jgi:hypothetical protein
VQEKVFKWPTQYLLSYVLEQNTFAAWFVLVSTVCRFSLKYVRVFLHGLSWSLPVFPQICQCFAAWFVLVSMPVFTQLYPCVSTPCPRKSGSFSRLISESMKTLIVLRGTFESACFFLFLVCNLRNE